MAELSCKYYHNTNSSLPLNLTTMNPLNKNSNSHITSSKKINEADKENYGENLNQAWKPAPRQSSSNFTILSRPKNINILGQCETRVPIQKPLSVTPLSITAKAFSPLAKPFTPSANTFSPSVKTSTPSYMSSSVKTLSSTAPAALVQVTAHANKDTLAKTIRNSAQTSLVERKEVIEMALLDNIPWISAEHVIETQEAATTEDTSLTSVSWTMMSLDPSVVDAAQEWFRSSSLAQRRTYTHGSTTLKAITKSRERSMKGYHPLCQTITDSMISYPYM